MSGTPGGRYLPKNRTREKKLAVPIHKASDSPLTFTGGFLLMQMILTISASVTRYSQLYVSCIFAPVEGRLRSVLVDSSRGKS